MAENVEKKDEPKFGITMNEVKYIASVGKCPVCGSRNVQFSLPFECRLETEDGKLKRVVLDFSNPQYWLKVTMTKCSYCGVEFHLRDSNDKFYEGLEETAKKSQGSPKVWYYDFDDFKTFDNNK
ncbi:MAG: hypothetical protein ACTSU2_02570 [Promethearchaeota archaeon]